MNKVLIILTVVCLQLLWAISVSAQNPVVYPAKDQSQEQMDQDKSSCHQWAVKETGFDPAQPQPAAPAPEAQSQQPSGQRLRGAARGAAVGAVVGEIANDDASEGAAAGAAAGTMVGGMKVRSERRAQNSAQQEQVQQQEATASQNAGNFNRAYSACLEGKGYTVK